MGVDLQIDRQKNVCPENTIIRIVDYGGCPAVECFADPVITADDLDIIVKAQCEIIGWEFIKDVDIRRDCDTGMYWYILIQGWSSKNKAS